MAAVKIIRVLLMAGEWKRACYVPGPGALPILPTLSLVLCAGCASCLGCFSSWVCLVSWPLPSPGARTVGEPVAHLASSFLVFCPGAAAWVGHCSLGFVCHALYCWGYSPGHWALGSLIMVPRRVWQVAAPTTRNHLQSAQSPYSPCEM